MKIIVGLGNFGDKYAYTYHNLGFLAAEALADKLGFSFSKRECDSSVASGYFSGEQIVIARPVTFMNLSGRAVAKLLQKYKASPKDFLVIFDDIDIEKGTVRFRERGSGGTHNGIRHIVDTLGTTDFPRIRIGIGRPPEHLPLADYVLSQVPKSERQLLFDTILLAADKVIEFIKERQQKDFDKNYND